MTAYYIGGATIGEALPAASVAAGLGVDGINAALPDIEARLAALQDTIAALATMPPLPSYPAMLANANLLVGAMTAAIAMPGMPPPPSIAASITALTALVTSLLAVVLDINTKLEAIVAFQDLLATAGLHIITHDGPRSSIGSDLQAEINAHLEGTGSTRTYGISLLTTNGGTWAAGAQVFKVSP